MKFDIVPKNSAHLPVYQGEQREVSTGPQIFGRFIKGDPNNIRLPLGDVPLSETSLRLIALIDCFASYDAMNNKYVMSRDGVEKDAAHLCIMVAGYKGEYCAFLLTTRGALTQVTSSINNHNVEAADTIEGTDLEGYPYIIKPCNISLRMPNSRATGYAYLTLDECVVQKLDNNELKAFCQYIEGEEFVENMNSINEEIKSQLESD